MANGWYKDTDGDHSLTNANNWATTEGGGTGFGRVPTAGDNAYFSATASNNDATAGAAFAPNNIYTRNADTGGTDNYTGTIAMATYALTTGTIKATNLNIGTSATSTCGDCTIYSLLTLSSGTLTSSGNLNTSAGTITENTGTIVMSGASKTIKLASGETICNFTPSGTIQVDTNPFTISGALVCSGTLDINGKALTIGTAATMTLAGTITDVAGGGYLDWTSTNTNPAGGTWNCNFRANASFSLAATTYGKDLRLINSTGAGTNTVTFGAGTYTVTGDITNVGHAATGAMTAAINNAAAISCTNFDSTTSGGTWSWTPATSGTPSLSCSGNVNMSVGVFAYPAGYTVTLSGTSKTIKFCSYLRNLTVSGTYSITSGSTQPTFLGTLNVSGTFDLTNNIYILINGAGASIIVSGTISASSGSGYIYYATTTTFPAGGTITAPVWILDNSCSITARTFGGLVKLGSSYGLAAPRTFTFLAGTFAFNGGISSNWTNQNGTIILDFTANPTINISAVTAIDFSRLTGAVNLLTGSSVWNITGAANFAGVDVVTDVAATFNFTGNTSGTQIITACASAVVLPAFVLNDSGATKQFSAGTFLLTSLTFAPSTDGTTTVDMNTNNPIVTVSGNIVYTGRASSTVTANFGTGAISGVAFNFSDTTGTLNFTTANSLTLTGNVSLAGVDLLTATSSTWNLTGTTGTQTINFSATVPTVVINASGATKQLTGSLTCTTFTLTIGVLQGNGQTLTVSGVSTFTAGTVTAGTATAFNFAGNLSIAAGITWTTGTETLTMSGTSKTITMAAGFTIYNFTPSGTIQMVSNGFTVSGALVCSGTLDTNALTLTATGTMTLAGTISGTGKLLWQSTNTMPTAGTLSCEVNIQSACSIPARTFGGLLKLINTAADTVTFGTAGSQTIVFSSGLTIASTVAGTLAINMNTYNPILSITGNLTYTGASSNIVAANFGTSTTEISGNLAFSDTTGTLNLTTGGPIIVYGTISLVGVDSLTATGTTWNLYGTANSQAINFAGLSVGAVVLDCAGATKQFAATGFTCTQLSFSTTADGIITADFATNASTIVCTGDWIYTGRALATIAISLGASVLSMVNLTFSDTVGTLNVNAGSSPIASSGNVDFQGVDSWTVGTSVITMSGTSKTFKGNDYTTYNLTISGTVANTGGIATISTLTCSGTFTVTENCNLANAGILDVSGTLSISSGKTFNMTAFAATLTGTISGAGELSIGGGAIPTGGTISCPVVPNGTMAIPARTWGGAFHIHVGSPGAVYTFGLGTHTITGVFDNVYALYSSYSITFTSGAVLNCSSGMILSYGGLCTFDAGTGTTFNVTGNLDWSNLVSYAGTSCLLNLTGNGSGVQTVELNGLTTCNLTVNDTGATKRISAAGYAVGSLVLTAGVLDHATNNPNVTVHGAVSLAGAATYSKGTGTLTLGGVVTGTSIVDFGNKSIEALIFDCSAATKQFSANGFTTVSITFAPTSDGTSTVDMGTNASTIVCSGDWVYTGRVSSTIAISLGASIVSMTNLTFSDTVGTLTVTPGSSQITASGAVTFAGIDTWTSSTETLTLTGTGKNFSPAGKTIYNLTVSGSIQQVAGNVTVANVFNDSNSYQIAAGRVLTIGAAGSITNTGTITSDGNILYLSTSDFTAGGTISCEVTIRATCKIPGRTFGALLTISNSTSTTVTFGTASSQTIVCSGGLIFDMSLGALSVNMNTYNPALTITGDLSYDGQAGAETCAVNLGNGAISVTGDVDFSDTMETFNLTTANIISVSGAVSLGGCDSLTATGTWNLTGAGSGTQIMSFAGKSIGSLTINDTGATKQIAAAGYAATNLTLTAGILDNATNNPNVTVHGNLSFAGPGIYNKGTGLITLGGNVAGTQTINFVGNDIESLTMNANGRTKQIEALGFTTVNLTLTDGTWDVAENDPDYTVTGNLSIGSIDDYLEGTGTLTLGGSSGTQDIDFNSYAVENINVNSTGAIKRFSGDNFYPQDFTLTAGTLDFATNNPDLYFSNDVTVAGGTWNKGTGMMLINGIATQNISLAAAYVEDIVVTNPSGATTIFDTGFVTDEFICTTAGAHLQFKNGETFNFLNVCRIYGTSVSKVTLTSASSGNFYLFNIGVTAAVELGYISIKDCHNAGLAATVSFGTNVSGNTGLTFVDEYVWIGDGPDSNFNTASNWVGAVAPTAASAVRYDATGVTNCTINTAPATLTNMDVVTGYSGTITFADDVTLTANFTQTSGVIMLAGYVLDVGGSFSATVGEFQPGSGEVKVDGDAVISAGVWLETTTGTLSITGTLDQAVNLGTNTFYLVRNQNTGGDVTFSNSFTCTTFEMVPDSSGIFGAGKTYTFTNWSVDGTSGHYVYLDTNGGQCTLILGSPNTVEWVDATNMDADMGAAITAIHSTDGSGNDNWTFWYVPVAAFLGTPLTGAPPLLVTFTDTTANTPTSWAWDFGDLETSILQNPIHTYLAAGTYTVALTATNLAGSDTSTRIDYILVVSASGTLMIGNPGYYEDFLRVDDLVCGESMAKLY